MRTRARISAVLAIVTIAGLLAGVGSAASAASTFPPLQWPAVDIADIPDSRNVLTRVDGGATVGCGAYASMKAFKVYGVGGELSNSLPIDAQPKPVACTGASQVGADGTLYTVVASPGSSAAQLAAYQGSTLKWIYTSPCRTIDSLTIGVNGNIYMLAVGGDDCVRVRLLGVEPTLRRGQTTPKVMANTTLTHEMSVRGSLATYQNGLIVKYWDGIEYFTYAGVARSTSGGPRFFPVGELREPHFESTIKGRVVAGVLADSDTQLSCFNGNATKSIDAFEYNVRRWSFAVPKCEQAMAVRPTYSGGAIADMYVPPPGGVGAHSQKIIALSATGTLLWSYTFARPSGMSFQVDLNGNVVIVRSAEINVLVDGRWKYFPELQFKMLNGVTGEVMPGTEYTPILDTSGAYGNFKVTNYEKQVSIGKNTLYLPLKQCADVYRCQPDKLYAIKMPGLQMDYPRGAILTTNKPWLNYVPMGDSFSSAEGVPNFIAPSDSDGCHRSNGAYGQLLNGAPGPKLVLGTYQPSTQLPHSSTTFVACSGATTGNVLHGIPEPPQVDALSANTDVVTITIGGNDAKFKDFVVACLFEDCGDPATSQPFFDRIANDLKGNDTSGLLGVYKKIREKSPHAKVYVVGYPQLMPESGCAQTDGWMVAFNALLVRARMGDVPAIATVTAIGKANGISDAKIAMLIAQGWFEFNIGETLVSRMLVQKLDAKIQQTVAELNDPLFTYVDPLEPNSPFNGHELCSAKPFFNGLDVAHPEYSFHPNGLGQNAYKDLLLANM